MALRFRKLPPALCMALVMVLALSLVMIFPQIALWLPGLVYGQ